MRSGWTRWNRLTGTERFPHESPRVVLSVDPVVLVPGKRQGPGGPVRWSVSVLVKDHTVPLGARLEERVAGEAADCSAGRAAVELAYRAMDDATRAGAPVVDSQVSDQQDGPEAHRTTERTGGAAS